MFRRIIGEFFVKNSSSRFSASTMYVLLSIMVVKPTFSACLMIMSLFASRDFMAFLKCSHIRQHYSWSHITFYLAAFFESCIRSVIHAYQQASWSHVSFHLAKFFSMFLSVSNSRQHTPLIHVSF